MQKMRKEIIRQHSYLSRLRRTYGNAADAFPSTKTYGNDAAALHSTKTYGNDAALHSTTATHSSGSCHSGELLP